MSFLGIPSAAKDHWLISVSKMFDAYAKIAEPLLASDDFGIVESDNRAEIICEAATRYPQILADVANATAVGASAAAVDAVRAALQVFRDQDDSWFLTMTPTPRHLLKMLCGPSHRPTGHMHESLTAEIDRMWTTHRRARARKCIVALRSAGKDIPERDADDDGRPCQGSPGHEHHRAHQSRQHAHISGEHRAAIDGPARPASTPGA